MKKGYLQIYTGNGKGKTTAAIGLAVRAAGTGMHTYIGQFMKGSHYSELNALERHKEIKLEQYGDARCIRREEVTEQHIQQATEGLSKAMRAMESNQFDIIILDEVNVAVWFGLLSVPDVCRCIDQRPETMEMILTGRYAPQEFIQRADLVTEMKEIKHYYTQNVPAREGIEK